MSSISSKDEDGRKTVTFSGLTMLIFFLAIIVSGFLAALLIPYLMEFRAG